RAGSARQGSRGRRIFRGRTGTTAVLLAAGLLASRLWLVEPVTVSSESMEPALPKGSTVLMFKPGPVLGPVKAGDLVVFTSPEDGNPAVKRAIAFGGQTVAIEDSVLVVDGVPQAEPGIDHSRIDGTYFGPVKVPAGHVFVLGDNRAGSIDSRAYGSVPLASLQATVLWPSGR
ncbi:signal peptidase I, partial [Arthrobacter sp. NPDC057388]|uniref:signal peptidase I n=1 Tax=Arthrobacter sp. NPDC057388 TaxID=3346116 RepID=UPI0036366D97